MMKWNYHHNKQNFIFEQISTNNCNYNHDNNLYVFNILTFIKILSTYVFWQIKTTNVTYILKNSILTYTFISNEQKIGIKQTKPNY